MPSRRLKALQGGCSNFFGASCGLRRRSIVDVEAMVLMMMVAIVVMYRSPVSFQFPRRRALTGSGLANRRPAPEPRAAQIRVPWRPAAESTGAGPGSRIARGGPRTVPNCSRTGGQSSGLPSSESTVDGFGEPRASPNQRHRLGSRP